MSISRKGRAGPSRTTRLVAVGALAAAALASTTGAGAGSAQMPGPTLEGRAVLPVATFAPGPVSGTLVQPAGKVVNGITFPLPSQPVQGFSSIVSGRHPGEFLAMPDNGYGAKATSADFLIRAYFIEPDFKTATGGTGSVHVGDFIQFRDPDGLMGFPIVRANGDRYLTGGDMDPESLQRAKNGDLWVGDEFGPWVLHFGADGALLDAPYAVPNPSAPGTVLMSPNNPRLVPPAVASQPNSRGFEAMAMSPDGRFLYATLEGANVADPDQSRRWVLEFSVRDQEFTGRRWKYRTDKPGYMVADAGRSTSTGSS